MIHGKTKIELYDVKRNIKQIIKSENTFQNTVLADYFKHFGEAGCDPFRAGNYDNNDIWKNALGGIFLLKNPETVGNKFMSLGNVMIGNGSYGVSNSGNPNELGSYNSQESSESGTEISQVYDFATNQANGNIGCVCLTSRVGGYIGYGNRSGQYHPSRSYNFESLQSDRGVINCNVPSAYGNWLINVSGDYSDGKIKIVKTRRSLITGSVFNGYSKTVEFDLSTVGDAYNRSGKDLAYGCDKVFDMGNGIFRFIPAVENRKYVAPGESVYYYEFDAENETLMQKSFTNSSSSTLLVSNYDPRDYDYPDVIHVCFFGNYALCILKEPTEYGSTSVAELFNVNNSEHTDTLDLAEITGVSTARWRRRNYIVLDGSWFVYLSDTGSYLYYIYDVVNKTVYPINAGNVSFASLITNPSLGAGVLDKLSTGIFRTEHIGLVHNPLYLATINNLQNYVTKTANQTMKVTYTLTEE